MKDQNNANGYGHKKLEISFSKLDQGKYFGHLEMVRIFLRAIRRAGIPVKYSEGFHPKPLISFDDPLPIGIESLNEKFYLSVIGNVKPQSITEKLNKHLPKGLCILRCRLAMNKPSNKTFSPAIYMVTNKDKGFDKGRINQFINAPEVLFTRTNRKGKTKTIDLKDAVLKLSLPDPSCLKMTLKSEPGKTVRPFEVLENIFGLSEKEIRRTAVVKL